MNKNDLKKLADLTIKSGVTGEIVSYVLHNLPRKQLVVYLKYLKNKQMKNTVLIISKNDLSDSFKKMIKTKFPNKSLVYRRDDSLGEGIVAQINDTVIDLSIKGYLSETVDGLKNIL